MRAFSLVALLVLASPAGAAPPDLTQGGEVPAGANHDITLGATGARGWIYSDKLCTTQARQIKVTRVEKGSPAAGKLAVGDVIVGVDGEPFAGDAREAFGRALTRAETEAAAGKLRLLVWRAGEIRKLELQLAVLGSYARTAPYGCEKSRRIMRRGLAALARRVAAPRYRANPICRSLNALALLAGGDPEHLPLVKREAQWAAGYSAGAFATWWYGHVILLLAEYVGATGDRSVMPGLRRLALEAARGQSAVGSWGHRFALPSGRLMGYGMMNAPGVPLTIGLELARRVGVDDPELKTAIARSARLIRFYAGKGAVPYGDHAPWIQTHDDNGKCGMSAVLFSLLGERAPATFFTRMSIACHGPARDLGHTGNFWNLLWAMPAVSLAGPEASGAWMETYGGWYFDLARRWDGTFQHQGPPQQGRDKTYGWDASGAYLLAYGVADRRLMLTGKGAETVPRLSREASARLIADGRGWRNDDRTSAYDKRSTEALLASLSSWSPVVRDRAAQALARRKFRDAQQLTALLEADALEARYGACQACAALRGAAAPAVPALRAALQADDLWLRVLAGEALARIGRPAVAAVPDLLTRAARASDEADPRGMEQRYHLISLFNRRGGLLSGSLEGVDRAALLAAVKAGLANEDGRARGALGTVYKRLSLEELRPLLPQILQASVESAPSGIMFADGIRLAGLELLSKHRVREGMQACATYLRNQNPWGARKRTPRILACLAAYGAHAHALLPELRRSAQRWQSGADPMRKSAEVSKLILAAATKLASDQARPKLTSITQQK